MKGVHQIYLFAATVVAAIAFFVWRSVDGSSPLFEADDLPQVRWEVHDFGQALLGGDSLDYSRLEAEFGPFIQATPVRAYWQRERDRLDLQDHFANVENLIDKEGVEAELAEVSARAAALLNVPVPEHLYYYISGIDLESPCIYYPGDAENPAFAFVGLDNFLGAGYPGYAGIEGYMRPELRRTQCAPKFAQATLETLVPRNFNDMTLLSEMVYYGRMALGVEALCPELAPNEWLGLTPEEWAFFEENERNIWEVFVRDQLLFSTDMMIRQRLVEPAPFSKLGTAVDGDIPGRVGRYVGYKLVRSFAAHNEKLTLNQILQIRDAKKFLRDAQYKP